MLLNKALKRGTNLTSVSVRKNGGKELKSILVRYPTIFSHFLIIRDLQGTIQKVIVGPGLSINTSQRVHQNYSSAKASWIP